MDSQNVAESYINWVKTNFNFYDLEKTGSIDIQTPYTNNFGENLSFIIKKTSDGLLLTDEGYTIWNLEINGVNITRKNTNRFRTLKSILGTEGIVLTDENHLIKRTNQKKLGQSIHELTQTLLKVNDLTYLKNNIVRGVFFDDVAEYFKINSEYKKIPGFSIDGLSLQHRIDYGFITKTGTKLVKLHNSLTRTVVESAIVTLVDTADFRKKHYDENESLNLLVNGIDSSKINTINLIESLNEYNITAIDFQNKEMVKEILAFG